MLRTPPPPASVPACTIIGGTPGPLARVNGPTPHSQLHVGPGACRSYPITAFALSPALFSLLPDGDLLRERVQLQRVLDCRMQEFRGSEVGERTSPGLCGRSAQWCKTTPESPASFRPSLEA
ncbi:hypothetical protein E5288_WYG004373 [Bos mutus]|uniref:Uncharacterized protein n=1 Tax=Bos mutus TaxID=72004 RepID=A0A6B0RV76_9CETA|nr:hypothetical protein [Bos mutus]